MEGVTILNTFEVVERAPGWTWWALIPIAISVFFTILAVRSIHSEYAVRRGYLHCSIGAAIAISLAMILTAKELPPETRYNVIVDESVSFTEFNEKYEVIKQEGRIYEVRERE